MKLSALALAAGLALSGAAQAKVPVPASHDWDLTPLYANWDTWEQEKSGFATKLDAMKQFQGKLGNSTELLKAMKLWDEQSKNLSRLYIYTSLNADTDLRNSDNTSRRGEVGLMYNEFETNISYLRPELIALGRDKVEAMIAAEPELAPYRFPLQLVMDGAAHTLTPESEQLLASAGTITGAASTTFGTFINAELPWDTMEIDGEATPVNPATYNKVRVSTDRDMRREGFDTFYGSLAKYQKTLASLLNTQVNAHVFQAKARNHENALAAALGDEKIPQAVYRSLVDSTNANLDTFHRYLKLRARLLEVEDQAYHDIYAPVIKTEMTFTIDTGIEMMMDSLEPMGEDYSQRIAKGLEDRWMDTYPKDAKRLGAYMSGRAYDVHPYVLMNYIDEFSWVSTLTHEWGHAIHSVYSNENQPWMTSGYSTFVAEIAATFQEHLLNKYVLDNAKNDDERLFYLGQALDRLRGTYFRQTLFAEFELAIHEAVEAGKPLSDTLLNEIFLDIQHRYHGHDQGVMTIPDEYAMEWAYVPHFYYNFYVYQYATSIAASAMFAEQILAGDKEAYDRYLTLLKAGGSDYPYELVKKAGVDLASPKPYEALIRRMNAMMDEMEAILDKRK